MKTTKKDEAPDKVPAPKPELKQLHNPGDPVLIKGNLIGIILSGYLWTMRDTKQYLYRIVVNAKDCAYRIGNNQVDQTDEPHLFNEDLEELQWRADQLCVMELFEEDLQKYQP